MQVAVQEVRRLQKYGVTAGELANYKAALMRDSEHLAAQKESMPSVDTLDYCMECLALNHTFMAQEEVRPLPWIQPHCGCAGCLPLCYVGALLDACCLHACCSSLELDRWMLIKSVGGVPFWMSFQCQR